MKIERDLVWDNILALYHKKLSTPSQYSNSAERAKLLLWMSREKPWQDPARYELPAAWEINKELSWATVVEEKLHENWIEVKNTILVYEYFEEGLFSKWGRDALLRAYTRIRKHPHIHARVEAALRVFTGQPTLRAMRTILDCLAPPEKGKRTIDIMTKIVERLRSQVATMKEKVKELVEENNALRASERKLRTSERKRRSRY